MREVKPNLLAKLTRTDEDHPKNFFYEYKGMSISASNLYKVGKTPE